jgi:hypothetical protein
MVRALLAGRKTQTRRIVKPQPITLGDAYSRSHSDDGAWLGEGCGNGRIPCPYGQPGDRLWVREAWCKFPEDSRDGNGAQTYYRADPSNTTAEASRVMNRNGVKWRPSIHMPRSLSRITLEITDVRVERLQDISEADAEAEGFELGSPPCIYNPTGWYRSLWEEINGAGSWGANPWVWAVSFKRLEA